MKHITKLTVATLWLLVCICSLHAQDLEYVVKQKMDDVFSQVDKNKIETGLLSDYGCLLVQPYAYNGVLSDTNYVSPAIWKGLYRSMYTTRINSKANLKEPDQVFNSLRSDAPTLLYLQYNRLNENALKNGLMVFENERLRETGQPGLPYLKKELFAISLPDVCGDTPKMTVTFRKENYISNLQELPTRMSIQFDPGTFGRIVTWDQPISHKYSSFGEKEIKISITLSNGKTLTSHTRIKVTQTLTQYAAPNDIDMTFSIAPTSWHSGGKIQIKYAAFNKEKKKLIRPLVIADESDILKYLSGGDVDLEYWLKNDNTSKIIQSINQLYDLVYVDNNDALDDILRNARLFEDAIERINGMRNSVCDQTHVIGIGMGGLVARYALKEMENRGINHNVSKYISINAPHKGLNIPLGLQAMIKHLNDINVIKKFLKDLGKKVGSFSEMLNRKAMKQMLVYSIDDKFHLQGDHEAFMQRYEAMGMPSKCQNVAISNGTQAGNPLFKPGSVFLEMEQSSVLLDFLFRMFSSQIKFETWVYALNHKDASEVYYGDINFFTQFFLIPITIEFKKETLDSTDDMLAIDGAYGSQIRIDNIFKDVNLSGSFKQQGFCFVPTLSALAYDDWENQLLKSFRLDPEKSRFDKIYSAQKNNEYTDLTSCKDILQQELAPQISGNSRNIQGDTRFELTNIPALFRLIPSSLIKVEWLFKYNHFKVVSNSGFEAVITPVNFLRGDTLKARITVSSLGLSYETLPLYIFSNEFKLTGSEYISPVPRRYSVNALPSGSVLTWNLAPNLEVVEKKDNYIVIKDKSDSKTTNELWIEASLNGATRRMKLKRARIERAEIVCKEYRPVMIRGERKTMFSYQVNIYPEGIPQEETSICWAATAYEPNGIFQKSLDLDARLNVESCRIADFTEEVKPVFPPSRLNAPVVPEIVNPDAIGLPDMNGIIVFVPTSKVGSIYGSVRPSIRDNYGSFYILKGFVWDYYAPRNSSQVSPNPASTTLNVSLEASENTSQGKARTASLPVTISLYNESGPVRTVEADTGRDNIQMDISDLPEGTYYLNVRKGDELEERQVIMIKR